MGELAQQYGTPLFVYDRGVLDAKLTLLRETLPPGFSIYYSVKANPTRAILQHFLHEGCGLEIASAGEYFQAVQAGCLGENIVFAGPGKTSAELKFVLSQGIGEIHVESVGEVHRLARMSQELGCEGERGRTGEPEERGTRRRHAHGRQSGTIWSR